MKLIKNFRRKKTIAKRARQLEYYTKKKKEIEEYNSELGRRWKEPLSKGLVDQVLAKQEECLADISMCNHYISVIERWFSIYSPNTEL